jgi:hypothetical protein
MMRQRRRASTSWNVSLNCGFLKRKKLVFVLNTGRQVMKLCVTLFGILTIFVGSFAIQEVESSLQALTPENYLYREAAGCANCKNPKEAFMLRAVGVDMSSGKAALDNRGWLASVHARSQSHEDRINTACAWCHAPTAAGATRDGQAAKPIPKGTWQGVTCGACHPGSVPREQRSASLLINFTPGTDPTDPDNYMFRNRQNAGELNAQCRFCHHESHDLLVEAKQEMLETGALRCIDCHMAAYAVSYGHVERFHNFTVEANIPHSCSGGMGRAMTCHDNTSAEWFRSRLKEVKGQRK